MAGKLSREELSQQQEQMYDNDELRRESVLVHYHSRGVQKAIREYKQAIYDLPEGSHILEVGCGEGHDLVKYHQAGLKATGIDISGRNIELTQEKLQAAGFDTSYAKRMNAEELDFPDQSFDLICGVAILHHLGDLEQTGREIRRLLKPGGKSIFIEPLGYNPALKLYRKLTPSARTPGEHPLKRPDIAAFTTAFDSHRLDCYLLCGLAANAALMLTHSKKLYNLLDAALYPLDSLLLKFGPQKYLAFMCKLEASA